MRITKEEFQKMYKLTWRSSIMRLIREGKINVDSSGLIDLEDGKNKKYIKYRQAKFNLSSKKEADIMDICGDEVNAIGKKIVTKTEFKNMFKIVWLSSVSQLIKNNLIVVNSEGLINLDDEKNKNYIKNRKAKLAFYAK